MAITTEYQIVVDLQVQAFLYAAAEQFATLLRAMRQHEYGTTCFFEAYVGAPTDMRTLVDDVVGLTRTEIVAMVGDPSSAPRPERSRSAILDPEGTEVVEVGGLLVPKAVITAAAFEGLVEKAQAMIGLVAANAAELRQFVDPPHIPGADRQPQSLRAIDNSFRHGLRVLFHEAAPHERTFRVAMDEPPEHPSVDLYLPGRGKSALDAINYGSVSCSEDRTLHHLEALRFLATRTGQLARSFLGYQTMGTDVVARRAVPRATPSRRGPRAVRVDRFRWWNRFR